MTIGPPADAELAPTARVLARAFRDNPLNHAVICSDDSDRRLRSNLHGMRALLPVAVRHGRVLVASSKGVVTAALVASPPGALPLPPPAAVPRLRCWLGQGWRVARRWGDVFEALEALHPLDSHWYLGTLGVDPPLQGRGVGMALLERWLVGVDDDAASAYLETDTAGNVSFYQRAGFAVEGETLILGVRIWLMRRPPQGPRASPEQ